MSIKWIGTAFVCSALAFACGGGSGGGGSGVPDGKLIVDVSASEAADICDFIISQAPPFQMIDCGDGTTVTLGFETQADEDQALAECTTNFSMIGSQVPNCTATVGEVEDCFIELGNQSQAELCSDATPAACEVLFNDPDCNG